MICRFCNIEADPISKQVVSMHGITQITETKPSDWKHIDRFLWCGKCDPRRKTYLTI